MKDSAGVYLSTSHTRHHQAQLEPVTCGILFNYTRTYYTFQEIVCLGFLFYIFKIALEF